MINSEKQTTNVPQGRDLKTDSLDAYIEASSVKGDAETTSEHLAASLASVLSHMRKPN